MLTAHERLTAHRPVLHLPRCCALAREADVHLDCGRHSCEVLLPLPSPPPIPSKPDSPPHGLPRFADPTLHKDTWARLKSHT